MESATVLLCHLIFGNQKRADSLKLARHITKLFELNINLICVHLAGEKNEVADFLSQIYLSDSNPKAKGTELGFKSAQHIQSDFPLMSVVTKEDLQNQFRETKPVLCTQLDTCHLNINNQLYWGLGPYEYKGMCLEESVPVLPASVPPQVKKINKHMSNLSMKDATLRNSLKVGSIFKYKLADTEIQKLKDHLKKNPSLSSGYYISEGILKSSFKNPDLTHNIIVLRTLVPFVLAYFHLTSHAGTKKMRSYIQQKYYWPGMVKDIDEFAKGCILCAIFKHSSTGKGEIGVPHKVLNPRHTWQMDIVNGMGQVRGYIAYITFEDVYSGYVVPVALKLETSAAIALALEENIIKMEIRKLLAFYNFNRNPRGP